MHSSVISSRGRTTIPEAVRDVLGVEPGDRVQYVVYHNGQVRMIPVRPLSRLFGFCRYEWPPVTVENMKRAVSDGATDE